MKRPDWTMYDVDAAGAVTAAVIALAIWLLVIAPLGRHGVERAAAAQAWHAGQGALAQRKQEVAALQREARELQAEIEQRIARAPQAREWNEVVARVVETARTAGVELDKVQPESPERAALIASAGLDLGGKASAAAVLRFLNDLSVDLPSAEVRSLSLQAQGLDDQPCRFGLSLRVRLLSQRPVFAGGGGAAP